ncbi:MAG TPA: histidine kinase [Mycobacteriales bacterium]|nr:histidine kinase [Mycobacteriales bacterium]
MAPGLPAARSSPWPISSWRPTAHAVVGLLFGAAAILVIAAVAVVWWAAVWSLVTGPTGGWYLAVIYAATAVAGPVVVLLCGPVFGALQRLRFRWLLGVDIPPAPWPAALPWRSSASWRQLGYHLLAPFIGIGAALVAVCWSAVGLAILLLANRTDGSSPARTVLTGLGVAVPAGVLLTVAPFLAHALARVDQRVAVPLLGVSRADLLSLQVDALSRSRSEIVAATDAERRRIERDLHDGAQQRLVSLAMNLGMARASLGDAPGPASDAIRQAHEEAMVALAELREFVRGLHPAVLNDRGLDAALSGIAARAPLPVKLRVDVAARCSPTIEAVAYFVVSEALTNVAKHARAGHAEVTVTRAADRLRVVVTDDGVGGATTGPAGTGGGTGLRGLAQRAAAVDGTLTVRSPAGGPTTITAELPCES